MIAHSQQSNNFLGGNSMAITLKKGQKLSLSKEAGLTKVTVGLGWLVNQYDTGENADLDSSVFMVGEDGKVPSDAEFIYYNQPKHPSGAVTHNGDNKKGTEVAGKDAETIDIDLTKVPDNIKKIVITATIYDPEGKLNFGQVSDSFIRISNAETKEQVCRYDLEEVFSMETAIVVGEIYNYNGDWKFQPVEKGFNGGLAALCAFYGVDVDS